MNYKNAYRAVLAGLFAVAAAAWVRGTPTLFSGLLVNEPGLAYNNTYVFDMNGHDASGFAAQANFSSATFAVATFGDGSQATGAITVANLAGLTTAFAFDSITLTSANNSSTTLLNASVQIMGPGGYPSYVLRNGSDWTVKATATGTLQSIAGAITANIPWVNASVVPSGSSAVLSATSSVVGTFYNSYSVLASTPALAVATPHFSGGQNAAGVSIAGTTLISPRDWQVGVTSAATATSIAAAVNGSAALSPLVSAAANSPSAGIVTLTSVLANSSANFPLASSTPTALTLSGAAMTGGGAPAFALNGHIIAIPSHGLTKALPVLYSTAGGGVIGGLSNQTTYYAIVVDANDVALAATSAAAQAGTFITFTSSTTQASAHVYTLSPLAISGTPGFKWQVSNDNLSWIDMGISSVTVTSYTAPYSSFAWDQIATNMRFIRLNVTAPSTGGLSLTVQLNAK